MWGRADNWWNSPGRAGTRTATSRKLTDKKREKKEESSLMKMKVAKRRLESKHERLLKY